MNLHRKDLELVRRDILKYLDGRRVDFDYMVDLSGLSPFTRRVLKIVKTIPYGETRSYSWVARNLGSRKLSRAVGQALSRNPVPIVIPCHRVISSDGSIGGFTGGSKLKRCLLAIESPAGTLRGRSG